MDSIKDMVLTFAAQHTWLSVSLTALGALLVIAQVVVLMTKTKKDDEILQKAESMPVLGQLLALLKSFAPFQKSSSGLVKSSEAEKL